MNNKNKAIALIALGQIMESAIHSYSAEIGTEIVEQASEQYLMPNSPMSSGEKQAVVDMVAAVKRRIALEEKDPLPSLQRIVANA